MRNQFENLRASTLYCRKCKATMEVRERLLLVLPDKEIYDYACKRCGESLGKREITLAEKARLEALALRQALTNRNPTSTLTAPSRRLSTTVPVFSLYSKPLKQCASFT